MEVTKADLKQRVTMAKERGRSANGDYEFTKDGLFTVWALIKAVKPSQSQQYDSFSMIGNATHQIYIKKNPNVVFTSYAWVLHKPRMSMERHFKVINLRETSTGLICLNCNLELGVNGEPVERNVNSIGDYDMDGRL